MGFKVLLATIIQPQASLLSWILNSGVTSQSSGFFSVVSEPSLPTRKVHLVIGDISANVPHSLHEETELQRGKGPIQRADKNREGGGEEAVLSLG